MPSLISFGAGSAKAFGLGKLASGPAIVTSGLVFYVDAALSASYPGSGTTWYDLSTNALHLTLGGGGFPTYSGGNSLLFSNQYLQNTTPNTSANITNNLTLEIWINMSSWTNYGGIICYGTGAGEQWSINSQNTKRDGTGTANGLAFGSNWPGTWYMVSPTSAVNVNQWWCIHITYSSNTVSWYLNGTFNSSVSLGVNPLTAVSGGYLSVGANTPGGLEYFGGKIGNLKVYNRLLNTTEMALNFKAHRAIYGL